MDSLSPGGRVSAARLLGLVVVLAVLWALWDTRFVYPLRILVTFLHEGSHGLAAVLTGGSIDRITVAADGSGLCFTRGGWRSLVIPAGYLGSMAWGSLILVLALRTRLGKAVSLGFGFGLIAVTVVYVRSWFGFASGLALGAALASAGRWLPEEVDQALLALIGSASCLYALFDLRHLASLGRGANDAASFSAEVLPLPPVVWAVLWAVLALACLAASLRVALSPGRRPGSGS